MDRNEYLLELRKAYHNNQTVEYSEKACLDGVLSWKKVDLFDYWHFDLDKFYYRIRSDGDNGNNKKLSEVEETENNIKIMQAFLDGKAIEEKEKDGKCWINLIFPFWDFVNHDYRIKKEPKLRWWTTEELKNRTGCVLLTKHTGTSHVIIEVDEKGNAILGRLGGTYHPSILLADYTLFDGGPCGVVD